MNRVLCAILFVMAAAPLRGAYVVRISDLGYSPTPPNPVKVAGRVVAIDPLVLTDGKGDLTVIGVPGRVGDFMILEGGYADGVLVVADTPGKAMLFTPASMTEMVFVTAGEFAMGQSGVGDDADPPDTTSSNLPQHMVSLPAYWIGSCEVTRGEFRRFMDAGGYSDARFWSGEGWAWKVANNKTEPRRWAEIQDMGSGPFLQTDSHPVVGVSYYEAEAYCNWAGGHLPTEAQWEKAARWDGHPRAYPWGDVWDAEKCNNFHDHNAAGGGYEMRQTAPVGSYPLGASPYGCQDMAGNVYEWCQDWFVSYPGAPYPFDYSGVDRAWRGGSWYYVELTGLPASCLQLCSWRLANQPNSQYANVGFRLAR